MVTKSDKSVSCNVGLGVNSKSEMVLDVGDKEELYKKAIEEIKENLNNLEKGIIIPRMATVAAVLKNMMPHYHWCGFYFGEEKEMVVGPYQGGLACPSIAYTGVCGTSVKKKECIIVPNVEAFPGYIVCDENSKSEIVVPLMDKKGRVIAVFDVDSLNLNDFDDTDRKFLEELMPILLEGEID